MSNLCIQVEDYVSPFAGQLPVIRTEDLIYIEKYETDAYGHWVFGPDDTSLVDKVNNRRLIVQEGATYLPTYHPDHVKLSAAEGQSLQSDLKDNDNAGFTMSLVVDPLSTSIVPVFGTLGDNSKTDGIGIFTSTNGAHFSARPDIKSITSGGTFDPLTPIFISLSTDIANGSCSIVAVQGENEYSNTATGAITPAGTFISVGNSRYSGPSGTVRSSIYEAIIHDRALTVNEMKAVAMRAKVRQEHHGIVF